MEKPFLEDLIRQNGYPIWDRSINLPSTETDLFYVVPFTKVDENGLTAMLVVTRNSGNLKFTYWTKEELGDLLEREDIYQSHIDMAELILEANTWTYTNDETELRRTLDEMMHMPFNDGRCSPVYVEGETFEWSCDPASIIDEAEVRSSRTNCPPGTYEVWTSVGTTQIFIGFEGCDDAGGGGGGDGGTTPGTGWPGDGGGNGGSPGSGSTYTGNNTNVGTDLGWNGGTVIGDLTGGPTKGGKDFTYDTYDEIFQENLLKLEDLLETNPFILMGDCPPEIYQDWMDLFGFEPPQSCYDKVDSLNNAQGTNGLTGTWELRPFYQSIAASAVVNMDYYSVTIDLLPSFNGQQININDFVDSIRFNLNTLTGKEFNPIFQEDTDSWNSDNPVGTALTIPSIPPNGASVMCTDYCDSGCWTFTTLQTPWLYEPGNDIHPVTGNRQFGVNQNSDGTITVYTRAIDRPTSLAHAITSNAVLEGGEEFWDNFVVNIRSYITDNGGQVQTNPNDIVLHRPNFNDLLEIMYNPAFPIHSLGCDH